MADPVEHKPKIRRRRSTKARLPLPETIDPLDIAVKRIADGEHGFGDSAALTLVTKQSRLIDAELSFVTVQTLSHKVGLALKAAALLLVLGAITAAAIFLWRASREPLAIVQPFTSTPALAQRGVDGTVLASGLLDHLTDIAERTGSRRRPSSYAGGWGDNIRVEVPNTGVTLTELMSLARRWAGNETVISGELIQRGNQIVLSARISGKPARRFAGTEANLDILLRQAAEGIYEDSQPYRHAVYLMNSGRFEQAIVKYEQIHRFGEATDQKWARSFLADEAIAQNDLRRANALIAAVLSEAPWFAYAVEVRASAAAVQGHDEEAVSWLSREANALASPEWGEMVTDRGLAVHQHLNKVNAALFHGDFGSALRHAHRASELNLYNFAETAPVVKASILVGLHDPQHAQRLLGRVPALRSLDAFGYLDRPFLLEDAFAEQRQWGPYTQALQRLDAALAQANLGLFRTTQVWPRLALAHALAARPAEAISLIRRTPNDCYRCMVARGQIASTLRKPKIAELWFRRAAAAAPSLPQAHLEWGRHHLAQSQFDKAIDQFREAHRRGPGWADPLRYWGDALLKSGRASEASERYKLAALKAPRWAALHLNWAVAELNAGRTQEAGERVKAARSMHLSPTDRARLGRIERAISSRLT